MGTLQEHTGGSPVAAQAEVVHPAGCGGEAEDQDGDAGDEDGDGPWCGVDAGGGHEVVGGLDADGEADDG